MTLSLPLSVWVSGKTKFILNLNNYRNAHFQVLNKAKKLYVEEVLAALPCDFKKFTGKAEIVFTLYQPTQRKVDKSNPLSIIEKFACDALVELGVFPDDSIEYMPLSIYAWGGVDKDNPRCEVEIRSL